MKTKFTKTSIETEFGTFHFDGNSKVTCDEGTYDEPAANCFSLVQVLDCPGATHICRKECYVHGLQAAEPELHNKYVLNSINLRRVLTSRNRRVILESFFINWIKTNVKKNFRWHVSGDVISYDHALFIRNISKLCPAITFWIYTRSFDFVKGLVNVSNLVVNLSVDADNYPAALHVARRFNLRMCYLTVDGEIKYSLSKGSVIFPSYDIRGRDLEEPTNHPWWKSLSLDHRKMVCPPDFFGQSETMRCGPCKKCLVQNK